MNTFRPGPFSILMRPIQTVAFGLLTFGLLNCGLTDAADSNTAADARAALERATAYMRSISKEGGYLWKYSLDLQERAGEVKATPTQVWIQPPGTPTMGMTFLRLYEATRDPRYLDAARAAADALATGQLESGGWDYLIDFDPEKLRLSYLRSDRGKLTPEQIAKRRNTSTFDDNNSQSAVRFLLAMVDAAKGSKDPRDERIREALDYGLKKMVEAQFPNGAWPQRWSGQPRRGEEFPVVKARYPESYPREHPKQNYYSHYTLNDNTMQDCIATLLDAHHRTGRSEFLASAKKGGDFLILAQMPEPQPAWAQQYNSQMEPAWARAFEPPAITGSESVSVLRTLMALYAETRDEKYLKPIPPAIAWFQRSAIGTDKWARYYELHTNKQLFGDRDGKIYYRLQDISEERQHGYSWSGNYGVAAMIAQYEKLKSQGPDAVPARRNPKSQAKGAKSGRSGELESEARAVIAALDSQGRWVTKGHTKKRDWEFNDHVETSLFIKNAGILADYIESLR
jgi:PelA/Pel-15E family pectate lyase